MTASEFYSYTLSEKERRQLVGHIKGSLEYGVTKVYSLLPQQAQQLVDAKLAEWGEPNVPRTATAHG